MSYLLCNQIWLDPPFANVATPQKLFKNSGKDNSLYCFLILLRRRVLYWKRVFPRLVFVTNSQNLQPKESMGQPSYTKYIRFVITNTCVRHQIILWLLLFLHFSFHQCLNITSYITSFVIPLLLVKSDLCLVTFIIPPNNIKYVDRRWRWIESCSMP